MITFRALAKDGRLDWGSHYNEARLREHLRDNEGKMFKLSREVPIRSLTQNAFYWVYLTKVSLETGNDENDLHEYLKATFLPKRLIKVKGRIEHEVETVGSTTKLTKQEFGEFLDKCAAHIGIALPTPAEVEEMGYIRN